MQKHFVTFYSPGTMFAETTEREIYAWDVNDAVTMARDIKERHGAVPYGFRFTTRTRGEFELDSKQSDQSPMYYLGGRVETLEEVEARHDPSEEILLENMRANGFERIIINTNSWKITQPLGDRDVVLDVTLT